MLSPETILAGLTAIANDWRWLAISWHALLAAFLITAFAGWRPSNRVLDYLLVAPLLSVSLMAWLSGNPFNGTAFASLAAVLVATVVRLPKTAVQVASPPWVACGVGLVALGWTYPHFVRTDSWTTYAYASPFGLLPCPTLSVVIGVTLLFRSLGSRARTAALALTALLYGAFGVFRLSVALDWGLLLASGTLAAALTRDVARRRSVRADPTERRRPLPGDSFIGEPLGTLTHAITIARGPHAVWPWLIQMGAGSRAGWYSYDVLDNGRKPSAAHVVPELQSIAVGTVFPALPGVTEGFIVLAVEPYRSLILGWPSPGCEPLVTWAFALEDRANDSVRLIVRARCAQGYRFLGLPSLVSKPLARLVHFLMQRKQLLGIARRVESPRAIMGRDRAPRRRIA